MPEIVEIVAIYGRTAEGDGVSRPFRCEGEDGRDYFVKLKNADRALTEIGGNPNLLWQVDPGQLVMIDHDNAFDSDFDPTDFGNFHALKEHLGAWAPEVRPEMGKWLQAGRAHLDDIWEEIPEEWLVNPHGDSRCGLDKSGLNAFLLAPQTDPDFWNPPNTLS